MRILHFYKTYYPDSFGGVEQVIYQLTEGNTNDDIKTSVLSLSIAPKKNVINLKRSRSIKVQQIISIASTPFSIEALHTFRNLAQEADIIHYHFPYPFMDLLHFLAKINKPTVVSYHSDILKQKNWLKIYRPLMRKFLSSVDRIVATSPNYFNTSTVLNQFRDKVKVIPIGIEPEPYLIVDEERERIWRQKLPDKFYLFIGTLRYYKGLDDLLFAMQGEHIPVVIIGSGPEENNIKNKAKKMGISHVFFLGSLSNEDKYAVLKICYGILFPSNLRTEAFGITLLEGALLAKPLISCEIGTGTSYINLHERTGLVVPPFEPMLLRAAMRTLWHNPILAEKYGKEASLHFNENFTAQKMRDRFHNIYRELFGKA